MDQTNKSIVVRVLMGKGECDKFQRGLSHKPTLDREFKKPEEAVRFLHKYRIGYAHIGFAFFINQSLPIKPLQYQGLEFIQYEFGHK